MPVELNQIVRDFAAAFKAVDLTEPTNKNYLPGIGPLEEKDAINRALELLKQKKPHIYLSAKTETYYPNSRQKCDLVIEKDWVIEFKLLRPFGNNGKEAEHWSEKLLHPYPGNRSLIGDCFKLLDSAFTERKAILVFGYEHTPPKIKLIPTINAFEVIAREIALVKLGPRYQAEFSGLIHKHHQQGTVYGWEILGHL